MTHVDHNHERFMLRCIELARAAKAEGNTAVGSLVVLGGEIVGEGVEQTPAGSQLCAHAEILACQEAVDRLGRRTLHKATLYSTAEPCFMCSYVIRQAEIARVVYGVESPIIGGVTSVHQILIDEALNQWKPAVRVVGGLLRTDCLRLRK